MSRLTCRVSTVTYIVNPPTLSSTGFPDLCSIIQNQTWNLTVLEVSSPVLVVAEDVIHHGRSPADLGHDHVAVDSFGDVGGLVAHRVADLLDRHTVAAHDRHGRVAALVGMPAADACFSGHLGSAS